MRIGEQPAWKVGTALSLAGSNPVLSAADAGGGLCALRHLWTGDPGHRTGRGQLGRYANGEQAASKTATGKRPRGFESPVFR